MPAQIAANHKISKIRWKGIFHWSRLRLSPLVLLILESLTWSTTPHWFTDYTNKNSTQYLRNLIMLYLCLNVRLAQKSTELEVTSRTQFLTRAIVKSASPFLYNLPHLMKAISPWRLTDLTLFLTRVYLSQVTKTGAVIYYNPTAMLLGVTKSVGNFNSFQRLPALQPLNSIGIPIDEGPFVSR